MVVADGELVARKLPAETPDLVIEAQPEALHGLIQGTVSRREALADGRVRVLAGSEQRLWDIVAMFAPAEADAAAGADTAVVAA